MWYPIDDYWDFHLSDLSDITDPPIPSYPRKKSKMPSESYNWPMNIQRILDETNKNGDTKLPVPNTNMAKIPLYRNKRNAPSLSNIGQG